MSTRTQTRVIDKVEELVNGFDADGKHFELVNDAEWGNTGWLSAVSANETTSPRRARYAFQNDYMHFSDPLIGTVNGEQEKGDLQGLQHVPYVEVDRVEEAIIRVAEWLAGGR